MRHYRINTIFLSLAFIGTLLGCMSMCAQNGAVTGFCVKGATPATTSGLNSSNTLQGVVPGGPSGCLVQVYISGTTTPATIYSDSQGHTLNNPFRATLSGQWTLYASTNSCYDVVLSGGIPPNYYPSPVALTGICPISNPIYPYGYTVSSLELGIKSDGITDDHDAVQAALNQVAAGTIGGVMFPPKATTLVNGPLLINTPQPGTLQAQTVDLDGGTLLITGDGIDIQPVQYNHAYKAGDVVVGAGYNQKVLADCTSGSTAPTWGTTAFSSSVTWGSCTMRTFGRNSETWGASEFVGYGRQISDGSNIQMANSTGTSSATIPSFSSTPAGTVADNGTSWLNTGVSVPSSGVWQCDQAVNGLLRIADGVRITIINGTIKAASTTAPCVINWSPFTWSRTAFNTNLTLSNITIAQTLPSDATVRTLSTGLFTTRGALLRSTNLNFYGNFAVKISMGGGTSQDFATDENDVNVFRNTYLWDLGRQYPLVARNTSYAAGNLLRGSANAIQVQGACTTAATAPTYPPTPGTTIVDGTCSMLILDLPAALFPEIEVATSQGSAFHDTYIESGPGFNLQSTQASGTIELDGGWIGDGSPSVGIRAESSAFAIHNFFIYNFATGTNSFGTGIYAHPSRSGTIYNNSLSNQATPLDLGNSVAVFGNTFATSGGSSAPVVVNGVYNTINSNTISSATADSIVLNTINNFVGNNRFISGAINCAVQGNTINARSTDIGATCNANMNNIIAPTTSSLNRFSPGLLQNNEVGFTDYTPSTTQVNGLLYGYNPAANNNGMAGLVAGGQGSLPAQTSCAAVANNTRRYFGCWFGASLGWSVDASGEHLTTLTADPSTHAASNFYVHSTAGLTLDNGTSFYRIPMAGTVIINHVACVKTITPLLVGYCSTQQDSTGACTCN